jgi:hypothetical protein
MNWHCFVTKFVPRNDTQVPKVVINWMRDYFPVTLCQSILIGS